LIDVASKISCRDTAVGERDSKPSFCEQNNAKNLIFLILKTRTLTGARGRSPTGTLFVLPLSGQKPHQGYILETISTKHIEKLHINQEIFLTTLPAMSQGGQRKGRAWGGLLYSPKRSQF
jgi:hypothetical protein